MSDKFNGFSQEEIKKMSSAKIKKLPTIVPVKQKSIKGHGILRMPEKRETADALKKEQRMKGNVESSLVGEINLDRSMSKSIEDALFYQPTLGSNKEAVEKKEIYPPSPLNDSSILKSADICNVSAASISSDDSFITNEIKSNKNINTDSPFKGISLKDFETHRKNIEEQNKQKKDMLYKAIEQHSEKTAAEARKIEEIKGELAKLDNDMAADVAILRQQIDNACVAYAAIEKQYIKIEAQFLKSKMELHNASEKKELLTEHLCTVITHNEDRKAQKLSELMEKVGISENGELKS